MGWRRDVVVADVPELLMYPPCNCPFQFNDWSRISCI